MKQCTSLLNSLTALLISPMNSYLASLVLPSCELQPTACQRAFSVHGRMESVADGQWDGDYGFRPFTVLPTDVDFEFSRSNGQDQGKTPKRFNVSAVWTPKAQQTLVNGALQGRKQNDPRGASMICRLTIWETLRTLAQCLNGFGMVDVVQKERYVDVKENVMLHDRRMVKDAVRRTALVGWTKNERDDEFG